MLQGHAGGSLARTCVTKLAAFLQDSDHNRTLPQFYVSRDLGFNPFLVKYIALLAMVKIVPSHPHLVAEHLDVILASVNDQDMSIRMRALDLVSAMVGLPTSKNCFQPTLTASILSGRPSKPPVNRATALVSSCPARSYSTSDGGTVTSAAYHSGTPTGRKSGIVSLSVACVSSPAFSANTVDLLSVNIRERHRLRMVLVGARRPRLRRTCRRRQTDPGPDGRHRGTCSGGKAIRSQPNGQAVER